MASPSPKKRKLNLQVPVIKVDRDPAFFVVPPVLLALLFAFCAYAPRDMFVFKRASSVQMAASAQPTRVEMPDPNADLPPYAMPAGCKNLLQGETAVTVSAAAENAPALNAVNGSCVDDANVAVAKPANSPAWWQVEVQGGQPGQELVIYGGGSNSPEGKLVGGFRVEVEYEGGETLERSFCQEGFALEGYESMKLDGSQGVKRIRVSSLKQDTPLVLREVQLIGYSAGY